ncbi:hypothetical protein [Mesorhizobium sp.]|uniref:hypothetical protein n=1 Tax=Mesorhizobium sp. TaxID=1871066 RepID=UPI0025C2E952|nr:hypothetical protein [Mesorhizobium sp.]
MVKAWPKRNWRVELPNSMLIDPMRAGQGDKSRDRRQEIGGHPAVQRLLSRRLPGACGINAKITPLLKAATY